MTSHVDSHTTPDGKLEMIQSVQTGNGIPMDKHNRRSTQTEKTKVSCKDECTLIDEAHTALDICGLWYFL